MDGLLLASMISARAFLLAAIVFAVMAIGIILFVILYQRRVINHQIQMREFNRQKELELMQASIRSEEDERMRIATELHDDVGATLSSVRLFLHQAVRQPDDKELVEQTKELLDLGIRKVRDLSHQLQPGTLQYLGLAKALQSYAEIISRSGSMRIEFIEYSEDWPEPDSARALAVYRIVQELVSNVIKHAGASLIRLSMSRHNGHPCVSFSHDGSGLSETEHHEQLFKSGAIGLKNIENRVKSSHLELVFPEDAAQYTIKVCLPPEPVAC